MSETALQLLQNQLVNPNLSSSQIKKIEKKIEVLQEFKKKQQKK